MANAWHAACWRGWSTVLQKSEARQGGRPMESRAKLAGHAIHPMLIVFPLGLLAMAVIFDIIERATGNAAFAAVGFWNIAAGIIGGLLAAVFGFWDWLAVPGGTRAKSIGLW